MSLDYLVYSAREVLIDGAALAAALAPAGWEIAIPPIHVWVGGVREPRPGPVDGVIYGWRQGAADAAEIRALIEQLPLAVPGARNHPRGGLAQRAHVAGCEATGMPFAFEPGELESYDEVPPALRERLAATRTQYVVRTGARQSAFAVQLQEAVWLAIAAAVEGIRLDPQQGAWT